MEYTHLRSYYLLTFSSEGCSADVAPCFVGENLFTEIKKILCNHCTQVQQNKYTEKFCLIRINVNVFCAIRHRKGTGSYGIYSYKIFYESRNLDKHFDLFSESYFYLKYKSLRVHNEYLQTSTVTVQRHGCMCPLGLNSPERFRSVLLVMCLTRLLGSCETVGESSFKFVDGRGVGLRSVSDYYNSAS